MELKVGDRMLLEEITPEHVVEERVEITEKAVEDISSCGKYVKMNYNTWKRLDTLTVLAVVKAKEADGEL